MKMNAKLLMMKIRIANDNGPWEASIPADGKGGVWVCNYEGRTIGLIELTRGPLKARIKFARLLARILNLAGAAIPVHESRPE